MKTTLKKIGFGLTMLALSLALLGTAQAANTSSNLDLQSGINIRALSQLSLVSGELTAVGTTTVPTQLTVKLDPNYQSRTITVAVDDKAIFVRHLFGKSSLSELTVGDHLQIFGRYDQDNGSLQALAVKDESIQLASNVTGIITSLDPNARTFTLSHQNGFSAKWLPLTVRISDDTRIVSTDGTILSLANLQLQQQVSVRGVLNTQAKTLLATQVRATVTASQPLPFSMQGNLTAISSTNLPATFTVEVKDILPPLDTRNGRLMPQSINSVTFRVDANTKLMGRSGATISLADFKIGDSVIVQGSRDSAGTILATTVRNDSLQAMQNAQGSIQSLDNSARTFVLVKADGSIVNIAVNGQTLFTIPDRTSSAFADLRLGYRIEVQGTLNSATNWLFASRVTVTDIPQSLPFSFKGELLRISGTSLPARITVRVDNILPPLEMRSRAMTGAEPINEVTILLDGNSKLLSNWGSVLGLDDLEVGDSVVVQGNRDAKGEITATMVRDDDYRDDPIDANRISLFGTIRSVDPDNSRFVFIVADGRSYTAQVPNNTVLIVPGVTDAKFADLVVGSQVKISGLLNQDTSIMQTSNITVTRANSHSNSDSDARDQHQCERGGYERE
jgi:hypothetical protein